MLRKKHFGKERRARREGVGERRERGVGERERRQEAATVS
jgi:hypothetical protein